MHKALTTRLLATAGKLRVDIRGGPCRPKISLTSSLITVQNFAHVSDTVSVHAEDATNFGTLSPGPLG